jgi:hypothetical protein
MPFTRDSAVERAKNDLAARLRVGVADVGLLAVTDKEFPDASLGAPADGEMAAMMISSGWQIEFEAEGKTYEYRADKYQLRLVNFEGRNHVIE